MHKADFGDLAVTSPSDQTLEYKLLTFINLRLHLNVIVLKTCILYSYYVF